MISDWAAAKEIWQAIKESDFDVADDLVVYVGVGPDGHLDVVVEAGEDWTGMEEEIEMLQAQIRNLEKALVRATSQVKRESHIESFQMVLPREPQ